MSLLKVESDEHFKRVGKGQTHYKLRTMGLLAAVAACALIGYSSIGSGIDTKMTPGSFDDS